eukprot:1053398-Prymnesium_polylepis.1
MVRPGVLSQIAPMAEYTLQKRPVVQSARAGERKHALERVDRVQDGYEGPGALAHRPRLDGMYAGSPAVA